MNEYIVIIVRTLILYTLILFVFRIMGKREIGELSILDLVVNIMIAEMAVVAIEQTEEPIMHTIVPILVLIVIQLVLAYVSLKSKRFRDFVDGKPTIIINRGKVDEHEMRKQRYNFDDMLMQLREKDVRNITDVEFAILESSGKLSVFTKDNNKEGGITIPLIIDGNVEIENLEKIQKTNLWLRQELRRRGYKDIKNISFCSYQNGEFYVDLKDEKK